MAKRNTYTPEYKAKNVIEILEGDRRSDRYKSKESTSIS